VLIASIRIKDQIDCCEPLMKGFLLPLGSFDSSSEERFGGIIDVCFCQFSIPGASPILGSNRESTMLVEC
jgi:hypothetical protein